MSIFFNKVERGNPANQSAPRKWYAVLRALRLVKEKEVSALIADETTLNPKEVEMAMDQFKKVLQRELLAGNTVQLGDWGSFRLTCNSAPADTKDGVTAHSIKSVSLRFTPGKALKEALQNATFVYTETLTAHSNTDARQAQ
jgi:predicted histone-like DNA-binding protein